MSIPSIYLTIYLLTGLRKRVDDRNRITRTQQRLNAWREQLPHLADAYLDWNSGRTTDTHSDSDDSMLVEMKVVSFFSELNYCCINQLTDLAHRQFYIAVLSPGNHPFPK